MLLVLCEIQSFPSMKEISMNGVASSSVRVFTYGTRNVVFAPGPEHPYSPKKTVLKIHSTLTTYVNNVYKHGTFFIIIPPITKYATHVYVRHKQEKN